MQFLHAIRIKAKLFDSFWFIPVLPFSHFLVHLQITEINFIIVIVVLILNLVVSGCIFLI